MDFIRLLLEDENSATSPIYNAISLIAPAAIGVILLLTTFYGIILGVRLAKAEDKEQRVKVQKTLTNFLIGALIVIVLLLILFAIRPYV